MADQWEYFIARMQWSGSGASYTYKDPDGAEYTGTQDVIFDTLGSSGWELVSVVAIEWRDINRANENTLTPHELGK